MITWLQIFTYTSTKLFGGCYYSTISLLIYYSVITVQDDKNKHVQEVDSSHYSLPI